MPLISKPNLSELTSLATCWKHRYPASDPSRLSFTERRQSKEARAAFFLSTRLADRPGTPEASPCDGCGLATHGWCEGCYSRVGPVLDQPYLAICSNCEGLKVVCEKCAERNISWSQGHAAFIQQASEARGLQQSTGVQCELDPDNEILISGINGEPVGISSINLETIASSSGFSTQDLIQQIREALQSQARQSDSEA